MHCYRHIRGKIIIEVVACFLLGTGALAGGLSAGRLGLLLSAPVLLLYGAYRALTLFAKDPAIQFDAKGLQLGRLFRVSAFKWDQLRDVRVNRVRLDESLGKFLPSWLPLEREYLELQFSGAGLNSTLLRLRSDLMQLPNKGAPALVDMIRAAQVAALGGRGAAMTRLGMDAREQAATAPPVSGIQAERFQRLGLNSEPEPTEEPQPVAHQEVAAQPYVPQRPTFGRKVV